jgi:hypothetical protein
MFGAANQDSETSLSNGKLLFKKQNEENTFDAVN